MPEHTTETTEALQAIADGYSYTVESGFVAVENPAFRPDDGSNPKLVFSLAALAEQEVRDLREALEEARLQIEYLHGKFPKTGTSETVLARIREALTRPRSLGAQGEEPRPMTGLLASLTPEQRAAALTYDGPDCIERPVVSHETRSALHNETCVSPAEHKAESDSRKHIVVSPLDDGEMENFVQDYSFRCDNGGGYDPTEFERLMLMDFGHSLLSEVAASPPPPPDGVTSPTLYEAGRTLLNRWVDAGALPEEMEWALGEFEQAWLAEDAALSPQPQPVAVGAVELGSPTMRQVWTKDERSVVLSYMDTDEADRAFNWLKRLVADRPDRTTPPTTDDSPVVPVASGEDA